MGSCSSKGRERDQNVPVNEWSFQRRPWAGVTWGPPPLTLPPAVPVNGQRAGSDCPGAVGSPRRGRGRDGAGNGKRGWGGRKGTWLLGHPGKKPGDRPCLLQGSSEENFSSENGTGKALWGVQVPLRGRAWTLTGGWGQSWRRGSSRYPPSGGATKLGLKQGRLRIDTQGVCPRAGGRWYWTGGGGGDGEGGWPPRWAWSGESWQPGGGRGRCQPARFLPLPGTSPAQRSLSRQEQNWFLDWQRQGARGRKQPRGQEGNGRPKGEVTRPEQGTRASLRSLRHLCSAL